MSEPMSAGEIEDVLSSIRRLVSEDLRPAGQGARPVVGRDKLILTPALRVVEGDFAGGDQPVPTDDGQEDAMGLEAPPSGLKAVLDDITRPAGMFDASFAAAFAPAEPAEAEVEAAPTPAPPLPLPSIGAVVAAVGAAVTDQRGHAPGDEAAEIETDWVPDGWSEPPVADLGQAPLPAEHDAPQAAPADQDAVPAPDATLSAAPPDHDDQAAKRRDDQAEAEAVAAIAASEDLEAEAMTAEPEPAAYGSAAFAEVVEPGDTTFDEEVLRDLVRDILREELQGGLGQRITHNVRKLVRAEINLALAGRDFD